MLFLFDIFSISNIVPHMASKLDDHFAAILEHRRARRGWAEIARRLGAVGVMTTPQNLSIFFKTRRKTAERIAGELKPFDQLAAGAIHKAPAENLLAVTGPELAPPSPTPAKKSKPGATKSVKISSLDRNDPRRWEALDDLKKGLPPG